MFFNNFNYGITSRSGGGVPFASDLAMKLDSRDGSSLIDSVGSESATVLVPEFVDTDGTFYLIGDNTRSAEKILDGNDYTIYCRCKMLEDIDSQRRFFSFGTTGRYLTVYNYYNNIAVKVSDGTNSDTDFVVDDKDTSIVPADYFDVLIQISSSTNQIINTIYNHLGDVVGTSTMDITGWTLNDDNNQADLIIGQTYGNTVVTNFKKFAGTKTISQCTDNSYNTGIQIHIPTLLSPVDISGNANHFTVSNDFTTNQVQYFSINYQSLEYGVDRYEDAVDSGMYNQYIIYNSDKTRVVIDESESTPSIDYPLGGFRVTAERSGVSDGVNHPDCMIRFTSSFMDRSNTTIWGASARTGYYDATNTSDWHISELNQKTLQTWLNAGYKGRLFVNFDSNSMGEFDRQTLLEIFLYTTNKTSDDHASVLNYTGDLFAAVMDGSNYDLDANNQVQLGTLSTTKPMVTIRLDDTRDVHYNDYWPLLQAQGVGGKAITGCHSNQMGETIGGVNFLDWTKTTELANAGWDVACHNREDDDYNTLAFLNDVEANFRLAIQEQEAQGILCNHYIGNRHSSSGKHVPYFAHKVGFQTHLAWGDYGADGNNANNQAIDKYRLSAIPADLNSPDDTYYLDADPNTDQIAAIKAQIDLCVSGNRWLIIMLHGYNSDKATALNEIIDYAQSEDVDIVTVTEALQNTAYL